MPQMTSLITSSSLPPPVQPATPTQDKEPLPMLQRELSDDLKEPLAKRERPPVSLTLVNSPASFGRSELATPPATATSETMEIPAPGKQAYSSASLDASSEEKPSSIEKADETGMTSPPASDTQSDKSCESRTASAPSLKRTHSEASLDEVAAVPEVTKKGRRNGKMFQCTGFGDCKMCFTRSEHLARHIRKHTGERPFECKCGRAFSRLDNLRQHIYTVHASEPQNYQTIKQCLPVHIPNSKKEHKATVSIAPPQPVAVLPGMSPVVQVGTRVSPGTAPMILPAQNAMAAASTAPMLHASPALPSRPSQQVVGLPGQPQGQQVQQPMALPVGYQMPIGLKHPSNTTTNYADTVQLSSSTQLPQGSPTHSAPLAPVHYYPQQRGAHQSPPVLYMGDVPQMYYMPQQQVQLVPQYLTQYGNPVHLAYTQSSQGVIMNGVPPLSPPVSHNTSPQVRNTPLPQ